MPGDTIQAQYDVLEAVAARFGQQASATSELLTRITGCVQTLEKGDWEGQGAAAFFAEMHGKVFPALKRLNHVLEEARSVTLEAKDILQRAEEEAAFLFDGYESGDGGRPAPAALPDVVAPLPGTFDKKRAAKTVGKPEEVADYAFLSGKATALKYVVKIGGREIPVYMPKTLGKGVTTHSIEEVAKGLAALPEASRAAITRVVVEPGRNPSDAHWEKVYKTPGFRSYMTAGAAGVVSIYPSSPKQTQDYLDGTLHHETGHIVSQKKWGSDTNDKRWDDWKAAIKSDKGVASKYAQNSPGEDFGETYQLYYQVKGTPQEAAIRKTMPERFKIIDEIEAGKR